MTRIVCFGAGPRFKGGIANYNTSLAKAFDKIRGNEVHIVSWTQQYPFIVPRTYLDTSSKIELLEGTDIRTTYLTNYNNPFTWAKTCDFIIELDPDFVVIQWSLAIQGIPIGWISRKLAKKGIQIIFDLHFVSQKEGSFLDKRLTHYGIKAADMYIAHAHHTARELELLFPGKSFQIKESGSFDDQKIPVLKLYHPVYDLFKINPDFDVERFKKDIGLRRHVFLFFGFIRKYKGLHHAIRAFHLLSREREDVSLLICGESFWNTLPEKKWSTKFKKYFFDLINRLILKNRQKETDYRPLELIDELNLQDKCRVFNEYIPNEDVHKYFQASDAVVLFYEYATPSGIESMSYNFKKPILATSVGHFPETIVNGINGYLADPDDYESMADSMKKIIEHPIDPEQIAAKTSKMSWDHYAASILQMINPHS